MISKIVGQAMMSKMMRQLRGGPQTMLPMSPAKGYGVPSFKGLTAKAMKRYAVPKQNPMSSPKTGGLLNPRKFK